MIEPLLAEEKKYCSHETLYLLTQVTLHYEEEDTVKIESLREEPERIKCFPLYTVLLAFNQTTVDLLSLGCQGTELEILQTGESCHAISLACLTATLQKKSINLP